MKFSKKCIQIFISAILLGASATAGATEILFAHVDSDGAYFDDGNRIRDMLLGSGYNVTTRILDQAVYNDYGSFDQIFVYDLYTGLDNTATQMSNYQGIANWYNGLTDQNLILDGRIISSTTPWVNPPETDWVRNYRDQLGLRGGGLFLGTDHASPGLDNGVFVDGINHIIDGIDVGRFHDMFYTPPLEAVVDTSSPLYIASLSQCSSDLSKQCINDNSSTSFVATGLQANGQTLTPVAFHGTVDDAWDNAAVSATMGSPTFGTCGNPGQPPCDVPEPLILSLFGLGMLGLGFARRKRIV